MKILSTHLQLDPVFDHTCTILAIGSALVRAIQAVNDAIAEVTCIVCAILLIPDDELTGAMALARYISLIL